MTNKTITVKVPEPKTYKFKGKTVIAVPEKRKRTCCGCIFEKDGTACLATEMKASGAPDCSQNNLIFKTAPDEDK